MNAGEIGCPRDKYCSLFSNIDGNKQSHYAIHCFLLHSTGDKDTFWIDFGKNRNFYVGRTDLFPVVNQVNRQ